jgi:glycosidase
MAHRTSLLVAVLIASALTTTAAPRVTRVEPPTWWAGFRVDTVQLVVEGRGLAGASASSASPLVTVLRTHPGRTETHLFVDLRIDPAAPAGDYPITLRAGGASTAFSYHIDRRVAAQGRFQGFDARDVLYLITPDRFANGDVSNDSVAGVREGVHRTEAYGRHGGDLRGIVQHLDYLTDLGVTALWLNPIIENDNGRISYHGYAATDLYRVDPRFGSNADYAALVDAAHQRGMKVVMDHVSNHVSILHRWIADPPAEGWINGTPADHQLTMHVKQCLTDPHADTTNIRNITDGWFNDQMPDLNQRNPFTATYLMQNTLWWVESTGLDAIREDTYPYADRAFLAGWGKRLRLEYPAFAIVGEAWMGEVPSVAPYLTGTRIPGQPESYCPSLADFPLYDAFLRVFESNGSITNVHTVLAQDFLYADPYRMMTFVDNHDVRRIGYLTSGDARRTRFALTLLLTLRGMPQLYYGTEIGMMGGKDDGTIRSDFPGGFPGDRRNAFDRSGRTAAENALFDWTRRLLHVRREHPALSTGKFTQYVPRKEVYFYFREERNDRILVVANNNADTTAVSLAPVMNRLTGVRELRNLLDDAAVPLTGTSVLTVPPYEALVLELRPAHP